MAGGKGGSQTTTQEVPEWQKQEIMEAIQKAKAMNIPYAPFTGIDVVAPAEGLNDNLNLGLGAFGMSPMKSVLPEAVTEGGLRGYRSHDIYQDNLEKFKTMYPDIYRRIDALVNEPNNPVSASTGAVGTINPVTGMPIVPETTASVPGYEERERMAAHHRAMAKASPQYSTWYDSVVDPSTGLPDPSKGQGDVSGYLNPIDYIFGGDGRTYNMNRD